MVRKVKLRQMGGSIGATLPREMVDRLHLKAGDEVSVLETEDGILIAPHDAHFERVMAAYEEGARKYRNAMRELAK
jgi:antitoxin MazE